MSARTVRLTAALAAALLAPAAQAYVRTTSSSGACFYWQERIIGFKINAARVATSQSCGDTTQSVDTAAIEAVRAGFRMWTGEIQACTDLQLFDDGLTDSRSIGFDQRNGAVNENLVVFRAGWCSEVAPGGVNDPCWDVDSFATSGAIGETCANKYNCFEDAQPGDRATIAVTTVTHEPRSGRIRDADIELADWNGQPGALASNQPPDGWYFTCTDDTSTRCGSYGQPDCAYIDLQSNVTHEVGHFVGLAHPCEIGTPDCGAGSPYRSVVMFPTASLASTSKRVLTSDDRAGVCDIHPVGRAAATCVPESGGGGGGCASGGAGGILSALLALGALARRAPRAP